MDDDQLMPHLLPTAISVPYDFPTTLDFPLILFHLIPSFPLHLFSEHPDRSSLHPCRQVGVSCLSPAAPQFTHSGPISLSSSLSSRL